MKSDIDVHALVSVNPALEASDVSSVFWTKADCYGYFDELVTKLEPEGCFTDKGAGLGSVKVGGTSTLGGAEFKIEIVETPV